MPIIPVGYALAVGRYRRELERLDPAALERELRDKSFDAKLRRYIREQVAIPQADIMRLTKRYDLNLAEYQLGVENRLAERQQEANAYRAEWEQYLRREPEERARTIKIWRTQMDDRVRDAHIIMESVAIPFDELFMTEDSGAIFAPPMSPNCRCYYEVVVLDEELELDEWGHVVNVPNEIMGAA